MSNSKTEAPKMPWFKHMANGSDIDAMAALEVDYPLIGYALYYKFKEMIIGREAKQIKIDQVSLKILCKKLDPINLSPATFLNILQLMNDYGMIQLFDTYFEMPSIEQEYNAYIEKKAETARRVAAHREKLQAQQKGESNTHVTSTSDNVTRTNTDVTSTSIDVLTGNTLQTDNSKSNNNNYSNNNSNSNIIILINTARLKKANGVDIKNELNEIRQIFEKGIPDPNESNTVLNFLVEEKTPPFGELPPLPPEKAEKKEKKYDEKAALKWNSFRACRDEFRKYYHEQYPGLNYPEIPDMSADGKCLRNIIDKIQKAMQAQQIELTTENTLQNFKVFLTQIKNHNWLYNNLTITNILSQYQVILQKSTANGSEQTNSNTGRSRKISTDYKQGLINSLLAGQSD